MSNRPSSPRVYISVLNWNSYEQTIACVRLLEQLDYDNYEIIIVDNASRDGSPEHIRGAFPDLRLIVAEENLGYAAGHQYTVDLALAEGAELIWLVNPDIAFEPDVLSALVDAYLEHGDAIYGSLVLDAEDPSKIAMACQRPLVNGRFNQEAIAVSWGQSCNELDVNGSVLHVANVHGCSMLIPMRIVRTFGFMSIDFFMYFEENDYCYRLARKGIKTFVVPSSLVKHGGRGSSASDKLQLVANYYFSRNRLVMVRKDSGFPAYFRAVVTKVHIYRTAKMLLGSLGVLRIFHQTTTLDDQVHWWSLRDAVLNRMGKTLSPDDQLANENAPDEGR